MVLAAGCMIAAASAVGTGAYLTWSPEELRNRISPGEVKVEVTETDWDPEKGSHLLPGDKVPKNPAAVNRGTLPVWVFMKVEIPVRTLQTTDTVTKRKRPAKETELFQFRADDSWELLDREQSGKSSSYLYGYRKLLGPGQKTECLFHEITMVNYLEGELSPAEKLQIPVTVNALQVSVCDENTEIKEVYQIYLKQQQQTGEGEVNS